MASFAAAEPMPFPRQLSSPIKIPYSHFFVLLVDVAQINRADVRAALVVNDDELRYVAGLNAVVKPVEVSLLGERSSVYKVFVNRGGVAPSYDIGGVSSVIGLIVTLLFIN